ncbi:M-phase phosphoprotein 8 [Falco rusticolus]|uniref:M-phase phosphoprotein 8 n=1 Tax=Falco rusticolus TaxID=120794 RepID=UPI0018868BCA|nr:M-phase phosphoprotein 8 [Falco rusticolus]XP_055557663.1 M-phase phosphoprotein 8 [Falco cherrug]
MCGTELYNLRTVTKQQTPSHGGLRPLGLAVWVSRAHPGRPGPGGKASGAKAPLGPGCRRAAASGGPSWGAPRPRFRGRGRRRHTQTGSSGRRSAAGLAAPAARRPAPAGSPPLASPAPPAGREDPAGARGPGRAAAPRASPTGASRRPCPLAAAGHRAEGPKASGLGAPPLCVTGWRDADWPGRRLAASSPGGGCRSRFSPLSFEIRPKMAAAAAGSGAEAAAAARLEGAEEEEETAAAAGDGEGDSSEAGKAAGALAAAGGESEEEEEDEEEEDEDVFEVEKILDVKTEGGKILYKVRWKGYTSDDDTWEPEVHLEDCKEVLLEFRKKIVDNKPKPIKKDVQKLSLNDDVFEAESDSDWQSETKGDVSPKKKKKSKDGEDRSPDDLKKKKSKSAKLKDKPRTECENSSDTLGLDSKPKKRTLEAKEDSKEPKKQRKEDTKEIKKKKGEVKDLKIKSEEDYKENKKSRKEKHGDVQFDSESSTLDDVFFQGTDNESSDLNFENKDEKQKVVSGEERLEQEIAEKNSIADRHLDGSASNEDDSIDAKVKRKKKKIEKVEDYKEEGRKVETQDNYLEKKSLHKKQKGQEKVKMVPGELEKVSPAPSPVLKRLKLTADERGHKSADSAGENQEKEVKKTETKEKSQKKESEKEEKSRKEQKGLKNGKQQVLSLGMDMQLEWLTLEDFQKHLDGEDENHVLTEPISSTLLRDAVKSGDYMTVKMALSSKEEYNLDQEDSSGMTLVMLAAAGGHDDLLRVLIRKGAKVNGRQKNGTTALIHAAEKNFLTTVAILLEAGAYVNMQQSSGETALMKACKRGNSDIVRLMIESGADCNILSKHQNSALHFAKQCNNVLVYEQLKSHLETLSRVAEDTIRDYFEARLALLEPVFPIACHRLCEGPDFSTDFNYKPPQNVPEGSGILLFVFHSNFFGKEVVARLCGPCSVQAVVLNDKFQLPVFLDSHFIYSFSPTAGLNKLFIRLAEAPTAKVKLLIGAYRVQLQ